MFSQNNEEQIICDLFTDYIGTCLSIGENNGVHLSNVKKLIDSGWSATLVEPAPKAFAELCVNYLHRDDVHCLNYAVSDFNGKAYFYDSGTHLNKGDKSLVSTLVRSEMEKWKPTTEFEKIEVQVIDFETLLEKSPYKSFDFISIDAEGTDLLILKQIDLDDVNCECICIEHNSSERVLKQIIDYCYHYGFKELDRNAENIIMVL